MDSLDDTSHDPGRGPGGEDPGTTRAYDREASPSEFPRGTAADPPSRLGPYEILEHLGDGAMGRVYKAVDTRLQRHVALKLLRIDEPGVVERFAREAQAQARVDHDNVCKVFDVGEEAGRNYIALQLLPGEPLTIASKRMSLEDKVRIGAAVADGLHAAHRQGLIHRDVKPGNIMVDGGEGRGWKAWVLDFGLAREIAAEGLTLTGVAVGTPQFMAPEQVRGDPERLDRRVDVYSLGATLYAILAGRPVHDGSTPLEILVKAATEDPISLRRLDPTVPADLETIVMKCLEREPGRRYDSARAVAEDLRRFLDGEAILARPPSLAYRVTKAVVRHRALVALGTAAAMVALALGGMWLRERSTAQHQAEIAQRFGQKVERAESLLWKEYTLPLHDIRPARQAAQQRLAEIQRDMARLGRVAEGPGNAVLGRGYLALDDPDTAHRQLQQAWDAGYRPPEVAYALGVATGRQYWTEVRALSRIRNSEARAARRAEIDAALRDPALEFLRASASTELDAPEYLDALLAFYSGDRQRGLDRARAAFERVPWFYEARLLEGEIEHAVAVEKLDAGDYELGLEAAQRAIEAYDGAARIAESDPRTHDGACQVWSTVLHHEVWRAGRGNPATFAAMTQACERAKTADPERLSVHTTIAGSLTTWAEHLLATGQDATTTIAGAEEAGGTAVRLAPDSAEALITWTWAKWQLGKQLLETGEDPTEALGVAISRGERAVALDPQNARAHDTVALAALDLASYEVSVGRDPTPTIDRCIAGFEHASELDPTSVPNYVNLGIAYEVKLEHWTGILGHDPTAIAAKATTALTRALELHPSLFWAHRTQGAIRRIQADHARMTGADPTPLVVEALASLDAAAAAHPNDVMTYVNRAQTLLVSARHSVSRGEAPDEALERARAAVGAALAVSPSDALTHSVACDIELEAAQWLLGRGVSPEDRLQAAASRLLRTTALSGREIVGFGRRGKIELLRALWLLKVGQDPLPAIDRGLGAVAQSIARFPNTAEAYLVRGRLHLLAGRSRKGTDSARDAAREAAASFEHAIELRPALQNECEPLRREAGELARTR